MREFLRFAGIAIIGDTTTPFYKNPLIIAVAALVVALIILVVALMLFRSSGKKKATAGGQAGSSDWQRSQAAGQPGAWGQQGIGMPVDNPWGQAGQQNNLQAAAWGGPQQPAGWDAQNAQQQAGGWSMPGSAQQPGGWGGAPGQPPQQQPAGWGAPAPPPQQPASWGAPGSAQQQPAGWNTPAAAGQQPGGWSGPPGQPPQQPASWGTPVPSQQQQPPGWGNQGAPPAGQGAAGGQRPWDSTLAPASQDPWAQQQAASPWSAQSNQQAPASYSGSGSGQSWGQTAQAVDQWGQPLQQQGQQGSWSPGMQQPSTPSGANPPMQAWQQPAQGPGQGQQGFAGGPFDSPDGDRTVLRSTSTGPHGRMGIIRIEEGKEPGRIYEVRKDTLSIGRSRESDIFLEDLAVSRLHASIISMGNGNYALRDEGSANGTKVNGQMVNKYQPYPLQDGDKIQLGQTVLVFSRR